MIRVSVVIPCKDERHALAACLDALDAQDLPRAEFEIIVVDGSSGSGCAAYAASRGARVIAEPARGPAGARNAGIREARGEIVAFTDADCVPRFDWLSNVVQAFEKDRDVAGVAGALRLPRDTLLGRLEDNDARVNYRGYITSNIAYRRDVLVEIGGFDATLQCAEDYDLAWRVLDAGHRIVHDASPIVLHDPPEVRGSVARYLRKQFWYARHDIPAHARAVGRAWRTSGPAVGSSSAIAGLMDAAERSVWTTGAIAGLGLGSPSLLAASLAGVALASSRRVAQVVSEIGEGKREAAAMVAVEAAKRLMRGAGTIVGLADLALARSRNAEVIPRLPSLPEPPALSAFAPQPAALAWGARA